jgi:hypothetical protein
MIITRLVGGLGNQMFQYAAGYALACRLGLPLKMDILDFKFYPDREYALHCFDIDAEFATQKEVYSLSGRPKSGLQRMSQLIKKINYKGSKAAGVLLKDPSNPPTCFVDTKSGYDVNFHKITGSCYLAGYWQSEMYFSDIADAIRRIYTIKYPLAGRNLVLADMIRATHSVAIHIRRGDYVTNPSARKVHGLITPKYYRAAIELLIQQMDDLEFFVFSDDPAWVRANLDFGRQVSVIDYNPSSVPWEDLRLMTLCNHHIIANSSYSWWGAWLSKNENQIVIAPGRWYLSKESSPRDLIPERWRTLDMPLEH